jgi:hypothetical protein
MIFLKGSSLYIPFVSGSRQGVIEKLQNVVGLGRPSEQK